MDTTKSVRKIVIDDKEFCWKADWFYIHENNDWTRVIKFRAWRVQGRGVTLRTNLTRTSPHWNDDSFVMPKDAAILIKYALEHGWEPDGENADFWLKNPTELKLDDLVLTDNN